MGVRGIAWLLFLGYLLAAAIQDFREKQVKIWVFVLFGFLGLITAGKNLGWQEHLKSSCLGLGLLGLGKVSRWEIGAGDGLFFLISGYLLSFWENMMMRCGGVMLCGLYAMIRFVWHRMHRGNRIGKENVPFLPFVAVWGVCVTAVQFFP